MSAEYLSTTQKALLAKALDSAGLPRVNEIRPRGFKGPAPLSSTQQRFWFLHHLDPTSGHCNTPAGIAIRGDLDARALGQALAEVLERHDVLRTIFPSQNGEPVQVVLQHVDGHPPFSDLTGLPTEERERSAREIFSDEAQRPFDIASEPSLRVRLLRLAPDLHWLIVVAHHIVFDTWSLGVFGRDMFAYYDAARQRRPPTVPPLEIQYADVACWEQEAAQQARLARQVAFWRRKMQGASELVRLPLAGPRRRLQSQTGRSLSFSMPSEIANALGAFSRRIGTSPFSLLLTALAVLLHRYGAGRDLTISSAVGTRKHRATEPLIGSFTNTLLFRIPLAGNAEFRDLLDRVRAIVLEAHDNSDVPFEQVLSAVQPSRNLSYTPFAQVMFNLQDADLAITSSSGLTISRLQLADRGLMQQDLAIHLRSANGTLHGQVQYVPDLLELETVRRLIADYKRTIGEMLARPESLVSELVFGRANANVAPERPVELVQPHLAIERHARLRPGRIAITCGAEHLTYGELDRRTTQLATTLCELGARPECRVALCVADPTNAVVALLAILKTAAACVLCDPGSSPARIRMTVRDAAVRIALADAAHAATVALPNVVVHRIDANTDGQHVVTIEPARRLGAPWHGDAVSLVLSTAGTTSAPKSVMETHNGLAHAIRTFKGVGRLTADTVMVATTPVTAFPGAVERLAPLVAGGRLVLVQDASGVNGETPEARVSRIAHAIEREAANVGHAVPPVWTAMLNAGWTPPPALRALCSGDDVGRDLLRRLTARDASLTNLYGSAETGAHATVGWQRTGNGIPIGSAADAMTVYVLDEYLQPVPIDRSGELYVAGPALARGYLDRPDLTAERFVPDPFSATPGARMYATRDIVRADQTGELRLLCRSDAFAIVQGSRVALGEVEAALRLSPATEAAAVVARDTPRGRRVIAYTTTARNNVAAPAAHRAVAAEIREFLKLQLPRRWWPDELFVLDALPIAATGRISRATLPDPALLATRRDDEAARPFTETERAVVEVWAAILTVEGVGPDDDFFEAGGDSLKAQRMIATLEGALEIRIPVYFAFAHPTVARLAAEIDRLRKLAMSDDDELRSVVAGLTDQEVDALLATVAERGPRI